MIDLARQRCLRHDFREAVCRCPGCGRFFCRECVTEHGGRLLCAACLLSEVTPDKAAPTRVLGRAAAFLLPLLGLLIAWLFFYWTDLTASFGVDSEHQPAVTAPLEPAGK